MIPVAAIAFIYLFKRITIKIDPNIGKVKQFYPTLPLETYSVISLMFDLKISALIG